MGVLTNPTVEDLIVNVRSMLNQPDANNSFWADEELIVWINEAIRRYFTEVILHNEGLFTTQADLDITAGSETIALPTDCFEIKALFKKVNTEYIVLDYRNDFTSSYTTQGGTSSLSYLPIYEFRGNSIVLKPTPQFTEVNGLRCEYIQFPQTILTGGDSMTNQVSPIFRDLIEMYVVYKAKLKESLVGGTDLTALAKSNVNDLYISFKDAIVGRSKFPQFTQPFDPEGN